MWIVKLALRRPYTFVVAAIVLLLLTPLVLLRTPTDIFPSINIPVVSVVWMYNGLNAREIEQRIVYNHERMIIMLRGQADTMHSSFTGIGIGMVMAVALVYLLLVVNFQSWLDPFIIITALPGALAGVVWGLYLTLTTLSVPALMGAIMSLGVATANAVLVVTFARNNLRKGLDPLAAAWEAGVGRLRPVLMTALAMIVGMLPLSLALGEGGEQNAPLGIAVIGGLILATVATLFFVPVVFSLLHRSVPAGPSLAELADTKSDD